MGHLSCRILANTTSHVFHSIDYSLYVLKSSKKVPIVAQKYINTTQRFTIVYEYFSEFI